MDFFKRIGQVLASFLYTPLYTGCMYLLFVLPTMWAASLSFWKMLFAILIIGGIAESCILFLQSFGLIPFVWIVKKNKISLSVSMALCVIFPLYDIFSLWRVLLEHRVRGVLVALFLSVLLLQFIFTSVLRILNFYEETREE